MNTYTGTPVNTVWLDCGLALLVGLLALSGPMLINADYGVGYVRGIYHAHHAEIRV